MCVVWCVVLGVLSLYYFVCVVLFVRGWCGVLCGVV